MERAEFVGSRRLDQPTFWRLQQVEFGQRGFHDGIVERASLRCGSILHDAPAQPAFE